MLFDNEIEDRSGQPDDTSITTTILYFSDEELATFKKLCKAGIIAEFGSNRFDRGNISDLLLLALNKLYGTNSGQ